MTLRAINGGGGEQAPLPSNPEAEIALIGCALMGNAAVEAADFIRPEDFGDPVHGLIWFVILEFVASNRPAEIIAVSQRLVDDGAFKQLGGLDFLMEVLDKAPPLTMARHFAELVRESAVKRGVAKLARDLDALAMSGEVAAVVLDAAERGVASLSEGEDQSGGGFSTFSDAMDGALAMIADAMGRQGGLAGMSTGLIDLDQKTGGLVPSDLLILAGRPSMGKTALATNIAYYAAKNYAYEPQPDGTRKTVSGGRVAFFSLEMSKEQLSLRIAADAAGISGDRARKGQIDMHEFGLIHDRMAEIRDMPLWIDDTGGLSLARLRARARRLKRTKGLDLIVVDYLQLITGAGGGDNRTQEVSNITMGLKALAKELNVPVLALSQLSRKVEERQDKRPQLADLRESGSIEQDADSVLFVYREAYYLARTEPSNPESSEHLQWSDKMSQVQGMAEVILGKARHGPIGTVRLSFNEDLTRFGNLARQQHYEGGH